MQKLSHVTKCYYFPFCYLLFVFLPQMRTLYFFALSAVLALVAGEEGARLLASKSLLNRYAVEGRDLTLQYNIYNVGTRYCLPHV